ncbi:MAG: hypothetical protein R3F33_08490 [Planctomycetota bacterium]
MSAAGPTPKPQEVHARCHNCGADVFWSPAHQGLYCEHCETVRPVVELPGQILERPLEQRPEGVATGVQGLMDGRALRCETCGAQVVLMGREISKFCGFCGSPHVLPTDQRRNPIQPESVIPLMLPRARVQQLFKKWLGRLWFRPNALRNLDLDKALGIYVPAWTFDAEADSHWRADAGYYYYVPVTRTVIVNGKPRVTTTQERRVRWEPAAGHRHDFFNDLQVLASKGVDAGLAEELGRFDTKALVPYQPEYLVGWEAEEYAIDLDGAWQEGRERMLETQRQRCSGDVPGDTQRNLQVRTDLDDVRWKHVLLPLWSLTYRFQGKRYAVLINGQTGAIVGRAPYSWVKILLAVLAVAAVVGIGIAVAQGQR